MQFPYRSILTPVSLAVLGFPLLAASQAKAPQQPQGKASESHPAAAKASPQPQLNDDGQRVFARNCSRCHNPPDGFSPRITATIVRHMRVRASLGQRDEDALLRFFNP